MVERCDVGGLPLDRLGQILGRPVAVAGEELVEEEPAGGRDAPAVLAHHSERRLDVGGRLLRR